MDPHRFDSLAKQLGTRLSRRDALRAGAGAAIGAVALSKTVPVLAQDADTAVKDRFISIRTYPFATEPLATAFDRLKPLVALMERQPGFIAIDFLEGDRGIYRILTFLDQTSAVDAASQEDAWIEENASDLLAGVPDIHSGDVFFRSELYAGCGCITGVDDACGSSRLTCCPTTTTPGGPGVCLTNTTTCPAVEGATPTPAAEPTETPACTGEGCACISGTEGACDDGLCCTGASQPGGTGTCTGDCGEGGCTSEGCECISGTEGACDDGLECCSTGDLGSSGTCQEACG